MITFPNAKINLGLNITGVLPDGYHTICSVMYPVPWCDVLEIVPSQKGHTTLTMSGNAVNCPTEKNLVYKAYKLMSEHYPVPVVDIYLHKVIPDGAGLGGGSADAAFTLRLLRDMFCHDVADAELADLACRLGADCPFFVFNRPMSVTGIGTDMQPSDISLRGFTIMIVKPDGSVSTAEAYAGVEPVVPDRTAIDIVSYVPVEQWSGLMVNDFERSVFKSVPECEAIKRDMYASGAVYAQMSGSGSAVFGLFAVEPPELSHLAKKYHSMHCFVSKLD